MLRKFASIKNTGRFVNCGPSGDVELKRYNLVFGENGRGKSTLCAILRSLQSGDPSHITGRKTLGGTDEPEMTILMHSGGHAIFTNGAWSRTVPEIAIFDATFVSENVHSGDVVDIDHRRSLYTIIVGEEGVKLARQIDELDEKARNKNTEIREKAAVLQAFAPGMTPEAFIALDQDASIDDKIDAKEKELQAARQAAQLKDRAAIAPMTLPAFPRVNLENLLAKTVEGVAADAEQRVRAQIQSHGMHDRGQTWLSEGLGYTKDNSCPFCNQNLDGADSLLGAYKDFFSKAYDDLRKEIDEMGRQISAALDEREISKVNRVVDQNAASVEFWMRFGDVTAPSWQGGGAGDTLHDLRLATLGLLARKAAAPLETIAPDRSFTDAVTALETVQRSVAAYNKDVTAANKVITAKKEAAGTADSAAIERELARLRAIKKRHDPAGIAACADYAKVVAEKKGFEDNKAALRTKLDEHTAAVIEKYEQTINQLLADFQAGFSITGTSHDYRGGVPASSYKIMINNVPIDLGDDQTPLSQPSFRNTLSAGARARLPSRSSLRSSPTIPGGQTRSSSSTIRSIARTVFARIAPSTRSRNAGRIARRLSCSLMTSSFSSGSGIAFTRRRTANAWSFPASASRTPRCANGTSKRPPRTSTRRTAKPFPNTMSLTPAHRGTWSRRSGPCSKRIARILAAVR